MEQKDRYSLGELFDNLEITFTELSERSKISDVTLGRVRNGQSVRRTTINILLRTFSEIYGIKLNLRNVDGIIIQGKPINSPPVIKQEYEEIPDDLQQGSISCKAFFLAQNISDTSWRRWRKEGLEGEQFVFEERERTGSKKEKYYFTPAQQEQALEILKRHGKLKTAESEEKSADKPAWYLP
jgi:hypothetical protein